MHQAGIEVLHGKVLPQHLLSSRGAHTDLWFGFTGCSEVVLVCGCHFAIEGGGQRKCLDDAAFVTWFQTWGEFQDSQDSEQDGSRMLGSCGAFPSTASQCKAQRKRSKSLPFENSQADK
eukprot:s109_g7.t1